MRNFTTNFWSKVEKTDTCWNWTGSQAPGGYGKASMNSKQVVAHRISYELAGNVIPDGMMLDHICHNRLCVRPDHLRLATRKQNSENVTGAYSNSKSGVRGVIRVKDRWRVQVRHNKKLYNVGYYTDLAEAEAVAIAKRLELFTHNDADRPAA